MELYFKFAYTWALLFIVFMGNGLLVYRAFGLKVKRAESCFLAFWTGWALLLVFLQFWHFFAPVNDLSRYIFCATGAIGFLWHVRVLWRMIFRRAPLQIFFYAFAVLFTVWMANRSLDTPTWLWDTGMYHMDAVKWANAYPIVPGLGNLHSRLGFSSTFFLYPAWINIGYWHNITWHIANSLLFLVLELQLVGSIIVMLRKRRLEVPNVFNAVWVPVTWWFLLSQETIPNISNDPPNFAIGILIASQLLTLIHSRELSRREARFRLMLIVLLASVGIAIKFSFGPVAVFTSLIALLVWLSKYGRIPSVDQTPKLPLGGTPAPDTAYPPPARQAAGTQWVQNSVAQSRTTVSQDVPVSVALANSPNATLAQVDSPPVEAPALAETSEFHRNGFVHEALPEATQVEVTAPHPRWAMLRTTLGVIALLGVTSMIVLIPMMARSVIMTGYPAYPLTVLPFNVDWRIPAEHGQLETRFIQAFARTHHQPVNTEAYVNQVLSDWTWFEPWREELMSPDLQRDYLSLAMPVVLTSLATLGLVILRVVPFFRRRTLPLKWSHWFIIYAIIISLFFWFFTAPDPRFTGATPWVLTLLMFTLFVHMLRLQSVRWLAYTVPLIVAVMFVLPFQLSKSIHPFIPAGPDGGLYSLEDGLIRIRLDSVRRWLKGDRGDSWTAAWGYWREESIRNLYPKELYTTRSGLLVWHPASNNNQCWDAPIPCTPYPHPALRLRVDGDLSQGFDLDLAPGDEPQTIN